MGGVEIKPDEMVAWFSGDLEVAPECITGTDDPRYIVFVMGAL